MSKSRKLPLGNLERCSLGLRLADKMARRLGYGGIAEITQHLRPLDVIIVCPETGKLLIESGGQQMPVTRRL